MRYVTRPRYVKEFVLVDGTGRTAKFMLANVVAAFERMEFVQEAVLLDNLLFLHRFGKVEYDTCEILLHTEMDMLSYNMMIGRNLNGRLHDASSVYSAPEPHRFLMRALREDGDAGADEILAERRLPIYISHDALCNAHVLFRVFPEVKMVNILRSPAAVVRSWVRRGWGRRWGADPKSLPICFEKRGAPVPWFIADVDLDYAAMSEVDRVIESVYAIHRKAKAEYASLGEPQRARVLFVTFEDMERWPERAVGRISEFLGRDPLANMNQILTRERLPRAVAPDAEARVLEELTAQASPGSRATLRRLMEEFGAFWRPLGEGKAMA